jgi:hypothetical protein
MTSARLELNLISHSHLNRPLIFIKCQMSCLDTFYILHLEERDEFPRMTEKGLELDKADFAVNGYEVDEEQYPRQSNNDASSSGKAKMKAYEVMIVDLSEEDTNDEDVVPLGDKNATLDPNAQESNDNDDDEGNSEGRSIPLIGLQLGVVSVGEEENEELARTGGQATPRKLFDYSSQPSPSDLRQESCPSLLSRSLPSNPSRSWRGKRPADSNYRCRQRPLDDTDAPMIIASQASVNESHNQPTDNKNMLMFNMLQKMQENQEASNKRNIDMLEQHWLEMELRMEQQQKDMDIRMEQ